MTRHKLPSEKQSKQEREKESTSKIYFLGKFYAPPEFDDLVSSKVQKETQIGV